MNVVILGATQGMGKALARLMADRGDRLFLLGRNADDLKLSADDLNARANTPVAGVAACDLLDSATFAPALAAAGKALGRVHAVVVTAGMFAAQEELETDLDRTAKLLTANFTNTVVFCEHARRMMLEQGGGTLCVFSSVAGDRGRKPVVLYGSSKAGLSYYLEALDHKYRRQGLVTICVKPGFVKTGMTAGLKPPPFAGEAVDVARRVLAAIDKGKPMVYAPFMWYWVMCVIRYLPRFVMRRIGF